MPGFMVGSLGSGVNATVRPYYSYTWEIQLLFEENVSQRASGAQSANPLVYAKDCTLPTFSTGREEVEGASLVYKFASMVNWEDVRITFYDVPTNNVNLADILKRWRRRVWNAERGIGRAEDYKKDSIIRVFNMNDTMLYRWTLYGSWPQSIRDGELTYTQSEGKIVDVIIAYDWGEIDPVVGAPTPSESIGDVRTIEGNVGGAL